MQILKSGRHAAAAEEEEEALESFEYAQSVLISRPASTLTQAACCYITIISRTPLEPFFYYTCAHLLCVCSCIESHLTLSVWSPLGRSALRKPTNTHWGLVTGTENTNISVKCHLHGYDGVIVEINLGCKFSNLERIKTATL